jgi:hypothetical protein
MAETRAVRGRQHLTATRLMMHVHTIMYAHNVLEPINVSAKRVANTQSVMVNQIASDIHNRAGVHESANVAAQPYILLIVQYHVVNSVVYILYHLLRFILLLRQLMHVNSYTDSDYTHSPMLPLYNIF